MCGPGVVGVVSGANARRGFQQVRSGLVSLNNKERVLPVLCSDQSTRLISPVLAPVLMHFGNINAPMGYTGCLYPHSRGAVCAKGRWDTSDHMLDPSSRRSVNLAWWFAYKHHRPTQTALSSTRRIATLRGDYDYALPGQGTTLR